MGVFKKDFFIGIIVCDLKSIVGNYPKGVSQPCLSQLIEWRVISIHSNLFKRYLCISNSQRFPWLVSSDYYMPSWTRTELIKSKLKVELCFFFLFICKSIIVDIIVIFCRWNDSLYRKP